MLQAGFACRVRRQPANHETMARLSQSVTTRSTSSSPSLPSPISSVTHDSKHDCKFCHKHPQGSFTEALDEFDRNLEEDNIFGGAGAGHARGQTVELVFQRRSGLTVSFQGKDEEWTHSFVGKTSLQVRACGAPRIDP
jgi:hypothetical protein